jgi:hypothetical protein
VRTPKLGLKADFYAFPIEDYPNPMQSAPSEWDIGEKIFRGNKHPWALSESEARRVYVAAFCEMRRQVRGAVQEEHPEKQGASELNETISEYAKLFWDAECYSTMVANIAHRAQLTSDDAATWITYTTAEIEFAQKRSNELANLQTKRRFLSRACLSLARLRQTFRLGTVATPFWAAFLVAIRDYEEIAWALGQIDGHRVARLNQASSGGRGKAAKLAPRLSSARKQFDDELAKNPKVTAPKLAEILVGVPSINLSYKKLYEIALERVKLHGRIEQATHTLPFATQKNKGA